MRVQLWTPVALSAIDTKDKEVEERLKGIPAEFEARRLTVEKLADLVTKPRPITQADLATLTEKVRLHVLRWFRMQRLIDADAAGDMPAWEISRLSVDASVRITLIDRDVPSYFQSLQHLLRYCVRPPFALERLSMRLGGDGRTSRVRHVLPRHGDTIWVANCGGDIRPRGNDRQGPAHFGPEVRKREKARMASPA